LLQFSFLQSLCFSKYDAKTLREGAVSNSSNIAADNRFLALDLGTVNRTMAFSRESLVHWVSSKIAAKH